MSKTRVLSIHRATDQETRPRRVFTRWGKPFVVVRISRLGSMFISRKHRGEHSHSMGEEERAMFSKEEDAVTEAEKLAGECGDWFFVLDLTGLGPDEVPANTD